MMLFKTFDQICAITLKIHKFGQMEQLRIFGTL